MFVWKGPRSECDYNPFGDHGSGYFLGFTLGMAFEWFIALFSRRQVVGLAFRVGLSALSSKAWKGLRGDSITLHLENRAVSVGAKVNGLDFCNFFYKAFELKTDKSPDVYRQKA